MSTPKCTRGVYKTIGTQEIDVDVYLPTESDAAHPVGQYQPLYGLRMHQLKAGSDRYPWRCFHAGLFEDGQS